MTKDACCSSSLAACMRATVLLTAAVDALSGAMDFVDAAADALVAVVGLAERLLRLRLRLQPRLLGLCFCHGCARPQPRSMCASCCCLLRLRLSVAVSDAMVAAKGADVLLGVIGVGGGVLVRRRPRLVVLTLQGRGVFNVSPVHVH